MLPNSSHFMAFIPYICMLQLLLIVIVSISLSHYIYLDFSSSVFFVLFVHISLHLTSHQSICIKLMKQRSMVPLHQRRLWELFTMGGE